MEERDLGALIENGLKDLAGRIDESRVEARQRFQQLEGEVRQTRTDLQGEIRQLDGKIEQTRTQLQGEIHRLDDKVHIQLEYVRSDIRLVAEGVANVNEKLDRHIGETAREFEEVRSLTRLSYVQLEKRVSALESRSTIS
jgi:predicted  nucleic acid-binding Zn-ribbon protein